MDASCGPGNALAQLSKHTQRDNSLQHERRQFVGASGQTGFRNAPGIDAGLNQDFQRFSQGNHVDFQPLHLQNQNTYAPSHPAQFGAQGGTHMQHDRGWVQDFSGLSLEEQGRAQAHSAGQRSDWHLQFMQSMHGTGGTQTTQNTPATTQHGWLSMQGPASMMGRQMGRQHVAAGQPDIHPQHMHLPHVDEQALSRHFDMLEEELEHAERAQRLQAQEHLMEPADDTEKQQFADAARQVHELMITGHAQRTLETALKFQQSDFLKLMSRILDRLVELSKEGDKLVQKATGDDIRQHLSDPLRHERGSGPDYHVPPHASVPPDLGGGSHKTTESHNVHSHLPDPLAHIRDGALDENLSSFQAAQVVSGGQVLGHGWMEDEMWDSPGRPAAQKRPSLLSELDQEVYDDYRSDDH